MRLSAYQERIIDDAITAAHSQYQDDDQKRNGFIAGVHACRGKNRDDLASMLMAANTAAHYASEQHHRDTNEAVGFRAGVEWVCDCMSALYKSIGITSIIEPTSQAYAKAANLLARNGVKVALYSDAPAVVDESAHH